MLLSWMWIGQLAAPDTWPSFEHLTQNLFLLGFSSCDLPSGQVPFTAECPVEPQIRHVGVSVQDEPKCPVFVHLIQCGTLFGCFLFLNSSHLNRILLFLRVIPKVIAFFLSSMFWVVIATPPLVPSGVAVQFEGRESASMITELTSSGFAPEVSVFRS